MRKPDEIKKGLECCLRRCDYDNGCAYAGSMKCCDNLKIDALAYIQGLESERDAAVEALIRYKKCIDYKNWPLVTATSSICNDCECENNRQWRGAKEDENNE